MHKGPKQASILKLFWLIWPGGFWFWGHFDRITSFNKEIRVAALHHGSPKFYFWTKQAAS